MQNYAAFHLGLHCLQKYSFRGFPEYKGLNLHADISSGARCQNFGLSLHLFANYVSSEGSDKSVQLCRVTLAFVA